MINCKQCVYCGLQLRTESPKLRKTWDLKKQPMLTENLKKKSK